MYTCKFIICHAIYTSFVYVYSGVVCMYMYMYMYMHVYLLWSWGYSVSLWKCRGGQILSQNHEQSLDRD